MSSSTGKISPHISREVYKRPPETRYSDMTSLMTDARYARDNHEIVECEWQGIEFLADTEEGRDVFFLRAQGRDMKLNSYTLSQVCSKGKFRKLDLPRMDLVTRASFMNQLWQETFSREDEDGSKIASMLVQTELDDSKRLRSITSQAYSRIWDIDLLSIVDRWATGGDYKPAVPTINKTFGNGSKPALFRSDRDMFTFFYTDRDNGSTDDFGGLRKGLVVMNSEVGYAKLTIDQFIFREVCSNFLIWGLESREVRSRKHIGNVQEFVNAFEGGLKEYATNISDEEWSSIEAATKVQFAATEEVAEKRLIKLGFDKSRAADIVQLAQDPQTGAGDLSLWSIVNGVTAYAQTLEFTDERIDMSAKAGKLMSLAS